MIPLDHRDTGNRANPYTEPNSCFSDPSDSLNLLNSMQVLLHLEKIPLGLRVQVLIWRHLETFLFPTGSSGIVLCSWRDGIQIIFSAMKSHVCACPCSVMLSGHHTPTIKSLSHLHKWLTTWYAAIESACWHLVLCLEGDIVKLIVTGVQRWKCNRKSGH